MTRIVQRSPLLQRILRVCKGALLLMAVGNQAQASAWLSRSVDLGAMPYALRVDSQRNVIYLSVPNANRLFVADLHTLAVQREVYIGFHPTGIDLSADRNTLYAALNQAGAISVYDLVHDVHTELDISLALGDSRTLDVVEAEPGIVFASASPCSGGFAYIVRADIAAQSASRVANQQIIRCTPTFALAGVGRLFVMDYEGSELSELDLTQTTAPILSSASIYLTAPTQANLVTAVSPAGDKLAFGDGTVIRTSDYSTLGSVHEGVPIFSADGSELITADGALPITVYRYNTTTLALTDIVPTTCYTNDGYPDAIRLLPNGDGWLVTSGTWLCSLRFIADGIFIDGFGG